MPDTPRPWKRGDKFSASHLNELVTVSRSLFPLSSSGGADVFSGPDGTAVSVPHNVWAYDIRIGLIVDTGPDGASDYDADDPRYWVKPAFIISDVGGEEVEVQEDPPAEEDGEPVEPFPVTVTNLAETVSRTHSLQKDGTRQVIILGFIDDSGAKRWVMVVEPPPFTARITGGDPESGYQWKEIEWDTATSSYVDKTGGRTDSTTGKLIYEDNSEYLGVNDIVNVIVKVDQHGVFAFTCTLVRVRWGKLTTDWVEGSNAVYVAPCMPDGTLITLGNAEDGQTVILCHVFSPVGMPNIVGLNLEEDDVIAYMPVDDTTGILLPVYCGVKIINCDGTFDAKHAHQIKYDAGFDVTAGATSDEVVVKVKIQSSDGFVDISQDETGCGLDIKCPSGSTEITHSATTGYDVDFDGVDFFKYPIHDSISIDFCARTFTRTTTTGDPEVFAEGENCEESG